MLHSKVKRTYRYKSSLLNENFTKIGSNIIESVFAICDQNLLDGGLSLVEIKESHCVEFLANAFGMLYSDIDKDFAALDKNGDSVVSEEEGLNAYKTFGIDLNRSPEIVVQSVLANMEHFDDPVHGSWKLVDSVGYDETDKAFILAWATLERFVYITSNTYSMDPPTMIRDFVLNLKNYLMKNMGGETKYWLNCLMEKNPPVWYLSFIRDFKFELRDNTFVLLCWGTYSETKQFKK